jgi:replicative DNA helicase
MDSNNRGVVLTTQRFEAAYNEGEQNCIGLCLKDPEALNTIVGVLNAEDFHLPKHQEIFRVISDLFKNGEYIDPITVGDVLGKKGLMPMIGGQAYLNNLSAVSFDSTKSEEYSQKVKEWAMIRELEKLNSGIVSTIQNGDVSNPLDIINLQAKALYNISDRLAKGNLAAASELCVEASQRYKEARVRRKQVLGQPTGFATLDRFTGGLGNGEMIVVAARPNVGKTALGLHFCEHIALNQNLPTLVFSLEMTKDRLMDRFVAMEAKVNALEMRKGLLSSEQNERVDAAIERLQEAPIFIDDSSGCTVTEMKAKTYKMLHRYSNLGLVMIDYFELIDPPHFRAESFNQLADISKEIKNFAKELPCPLVLLAQLNRNADGRKDKTPIVTDIGGTDRIGKDADVVMMLHTQESYERPEAFSYQERNGVAIKPIELIVAKQRNGPKGTLMLNYNRASNQFREINH